MKRLVCLMVAAAMLLGLAACVPTTQPNEPAATAVPGANETAQPATAPKPPLPRKYQTTISFGT